MEPVDRDREAPPTDQDDTDQPGRDDPISLWPLSFEDVVRALHKTPPVKRPGEDRPTSDTQ